MGPLLQLILEFARLEKQSSIFPRVGKTEDCFGVRRLACALFFEACFETVRGKSR